jgi:chromosome segregation ATPase
MKVEIHEIEERKNQHINELMINHENAFTEMKVYYNDITRENIELIKVHKDKLKEIKGTIQANDYIVADLCKKEKELKKPLNIAQQQRDNLRKSTMTFDKDKMALTNAKGCLKDFTKSLDEIRQNKKKLDDDFKRVEKEKEDMYKRFEIVVG